MKYEKNALFKSEKLGKSSPVESLHMFSQSALQHSIHVFYILRIYVLSSSLLFLQVGICHRFFCTFIFSTGVIFGDFPRSTHVGACPSQCYTAGVGLSSDFDRHLSFLLGLLGCKQCCDKQHAAMSLCIDGRTYAKEDFGNTAVQASVISVCGAAFRPVSFQCIVSSAVLNTSLPVWALVPLEWRSLHSSLLHVSLYWTMDVNVQGLLERKIPL